MQNFICTDTEQLLHDDAVRTRIFEKTGTVYSAVEQIPVQVLINHAVATVTELPPPAHGPDDQLEPRWDKVPGEWTLVYDVIPAPLEAVKARALAAIQAEYLRRETLPVEHLGRQWKGGSSSGQGIRDAAEISAQLGLETVELWDINNDSQHYTLAEARQIAAVIGVAYQQLFAQRAGLLKAIAEAETVDDVLAVSWEGAGD